LTLADVHQLRDGTRAVIHDTSEKISLEGIRNSSAVPHPAGTVAMSRTASVGFTCIMGTTMATSQDFVTWTCGDRLDNRFLLWALRGERAQILSRMQGSTHKTIYMPDLEDLRISLPPLAVQRSIADYLDAETARLDALIVKKRQLIHLLEERRTSVTLAGVTGRLTNPSAPVPCELSWAKALPQHWDVALLRLVARQGTGHTPSRDHPEWWIADQCVVPWVTTGEVQQVRSDRVRTIHETRERISHIGIENSSAEVHPKGTVFLCRTAASAGYSGIMGAAMATSQDIATWTCGERIDPEYLLFCLRAMRKDLLERLATGSTHRTIYMPEIQGLQVPVPPIGEQKEIAALLKGEIDRSFAATDAVARQIDLLAEHRQALITSAVTGELGMLGAA
jgi:type I restriction enzyme S subunit